MEVEAAIDAAVGALFLVGRTRSHLAQRPPLELVLVFGGQSCRSGIVGRFADHVIGRFDLRPEGVGEALLDQA